MNIIAYHGSPKLFKEFSLDFVGSESGTSGAGYGLYFSTSKADALTYGKYSYECLLQLENNISNVKIDFSFDMVKLIIEKCNELYGKNYYENYGEILPSEERKNEIIHELISCCDSDTDIIGDLINCLFGGKCKNMFTILTQYGFTHTIDDNENKDKTITHYIVYDLSLIKINKVTNYLS